MDRLTDISFERAHALLEPALRGPMRQAIVSQLSASKNLGSALIRLRESMRTHTWQGRDSAVDMGRIIRALDARTREHGFHALHDWDGKAQRVNPNTIAVDVLNFVMDRRGDDPAEPAVLAILIDYYFLYVLALLSLTIWDEGDANENLDRLNQLLQHLQGPQGSGQPFVANSESLLLVATSHYETEDGAYDRLLSRVKTLSRAHRLQMALVHAQSLGSHLRFGFEATYGRDTLNMRADNVADYPWLCFALVDVMREYSRLHDEGIEGPEKDIVIEALVNGLSPDARAFLSDHPPGSLAPYEEERLEFRERFYAHKDYLLDAFERHRPSHQAYSPISFFFNFSQNVLKGTVVDALLRGEPWSASLSDLLTGLPRDGDQRRTKEKLAIVLMAYARARPDTIRGRLMPAIVYDPTAGRQAFAVMMRKLKE
jgi:hypothetical protein